MSGVYRVDFTILRADDEGDFKPVAEGSAMECESLDEAIDYAMSALQLHEWDEVTSDDPNT